MWTEMVCQQPETPSEVQSLCVSVATVTVEEVIMKSPACLTVWWALVIRAHAVSPSSSWWRLLLCRTCQPASDVMAAVRGCQCYRHNSIKRSITAKATNDCVSVTAQQQTHPSLCDTAGQKWITGEGRFFLSAELENWQVINQKA